MRTSNTLILPVCAGLMLASGPAGAQQADEDCVELEGTPPGLYVTVDQSQVYLIQGDKLVELDPGEAAYASETDLACIRVPPKMLEWPCGTAEALSLQRAPTYRFEDLPVIGKAREVARRYFEENRVIGPPLEWLNSEIHGTFEAGELTDLPTSGYWYLPAGPDPFASPKRPRTQLISLFWSTRQAVLDGNTIEALRGMFPEDAIPVVFVFHEDHEVPVSYFGSDVTLEELTDAFFERGIQVAPVPVWYAGDYHLAVSVEEFERLFDIPDLDQIDAAQIALLTQDMKAYGFSRKPISVSVLAENETFVIDQPERVRVAQSLGFESIPTVIFYYSGISHLAGCGVPLPQGSPVAGSLVAPVPPPLPAPEKRASDS